MVSKSMLTAMVGAGTVALFAWLGQFVSGIFEDTASMLEDIQSGKPVTVQTVITDQDVDRLRSFHQDVLKASEEELASK